MTINEAYRELKHLEKMGVNIFEDAEILRTNYDLQFANDYFEDTGEMKSEMKSQGKCADYNTKVTGFSLRSMSAYRSGHLKLVFNPFDVKGYKEFFWMIHPWKDEFKCIQNAAVGIQKLARRFELQDSILSLRQYECPFSLSRDCFMEILGVMNDVIEADDFVVGLTRYSEINHLTTCYLLNGAENLKKQYELIGGSAVQLFKSMGAEFLYSSYGTTKQTNHVINTFRILAHSSSNLSLSKEELEELNKIAKKRPSEKEMARKMAESAQFSFDKNFLNGLREVRTIKQPREAELTMRLAQSMAPELLENLIEKVLILMNNLSYLKGLAENDIRPEDAYQELIECYEQSESYTKDLEDFVLRPAAMYFHKDLKELKEVDINEYYVLRFSKHVTLENELYYKCGELRFIADGNWPSLMEILENLPTKEDTFRMCLTYLSYKLRWIESHIVGFDHINKEKTSPQQAEKKKRIKVFREFISDSCRSDIIIQKIHRLIGNKKDSEALKIITRAWWINWLYDKPTATSIRNEFPTITCSDTIVSRCLNESKPTKNGKVDEEKIEEIRKGYEAI